MDSNQKPVVYKSEANGKCFIRYGNSPEKEITEAEYYQHLADKERWLENMVNEKTTFPQAPKRQEVAEIPDGYNGRKMRIYRHHTEEHLFTFEMGTITGNYYLTDDAMVIESIFNSKRGNGDFLPALQMLLRYVPDPGKPVTLVNVPARLIAFLKRADLGPVYQITKDSVIIWQKSEA